MTGDLVSEWKAGIRGAGNHQFGDCRDSSCWRREPERPKLGFLGIY